MYNCENRNFGDYLYISNVKKRYTLSLTKKLEVLEILQQFIAVIDLEFRKKVLQNLNEVKNYSNLSI